MVAVFSESVWCQGHHEGTFYYENNVAIATRIRGVISVHLFLSTTHVEHQKILNYYCDIAQHTATMYVE